MKSCFDVGSGLLGSVMPCRSGTLPVTLTGLAGRRHPQFRTSPPPNHAGSAGDEGQVCPAERSVDLHRGYSGNPHLVQPLAPRKVPSTPYADVFHPPLPNPRRDSRGAATGCVFPDDHHHEPSLTGSWVRLAPCESAVRRLPEWEHFTLRGSGDCAFAAPSLGLQFLSRRLGARACPGVNEGC
jgi:hypothetical protein